MCRRLRNSSTKLVAAGPAALSPRARRLLVTMPGWSSKSQAAPSLPTSALRGLYIALRSVPTDTDDAHYLRFMESALQTDEGEGMVEIIPRFHNWAQTLMVVKPQDQTCTRAAQAD